MQNTEVERTQVAVGVVFDANRRVLLGQRTAPPELRGKWEFPGGKMKPHESPAQALERELFEEVGIQVLDSQPFMSLDYAYPTGTVQLNFRTVEAYTGLPTSRERQAIQWVEVDVLHQIDILPASAPAVEKLQRRSASMAAAMSDRAKRGN